MLVLILKKIPNVSMKKIGQKGFTLLEILLVVAAIGILAGIVILALNPSKQLGDTRNAQRQSDVTTILNAVYQYSIDNNGSFPAGLDSDNASPQVVGTGAGCTCTATSTTAAAQKCANLSALVPTYLVGIPQDPTTGLASSTDYYINRDANGRITVGACAPESNEVISVTR